MQFKAGKLISILNSKLGIGVIFYKLIENNEIEMIRLIDINRENKTGKFLRLNDNKVFNDVSFEVILNNYNILEPHIKIAYLFCKDNFERLIIKSIQKSRMPDYIFDGRIGGHYDLTREALMYCDEISDPIREEIFSFYKIDDIENVLFLLSEHNNDVAVNIMNILQLYPEILCDVYNDNNMIFLEDIDIEVDNNMVEKYHIGMNLSLLDFDSYRIVNNGKTVYIVKEVEYLHTLLMGKSDNIRFFDNEYYNGENINDNIIPF